MKKVKAARAIVEVMEKEEVEKAFCVPGESFLSIINELYEHPSIELIYGRHEGGISFMTEAYAKGTGKVGVCFATRGPGATNLSIGLHTAFQDSTPLVAFIGQVERSYIEREGFQEIKLADYFSKIVKWTVEINEAKRIPELVHRAFHIARSGRPGPVLVSLPQDLLDEVAEMEFSTAKVYSSPRPQKEAVNQTLDLLMTAKRPLIIAGGGVARGNARKELLSFAEKLHIPVATAFRRFDAFPNNHSLYVGSLGVSIPKYLKDLTLNADLVIAIGTRFSQITTENYSRINPESKLIHVDISPDEINKVYWPSIGIVADAKYFLSDILEEIDHRNLDNTTVDWKRYSEELRKQYEKNSLPKQSYDNNFVNLEGFVYDLMNELPSDAVITSDAGNFFGWLSKYYVFQEGGSYIGPTSGAMGYGLPGAIGAKLANRDKVVVSFSGDGGFMMTMQELETAVRHKIPIIAIVANNNMYGTIRMHQERNYPDKVIATELSNPNFAEISVLMGGAGEVVKNNEEFIPALKRALEAKIPYVLELLTDPQQITVTKTIDELKSGK